MNLHLCKYMLQTQAHTRTHSPTRSWHSCGMFLAEDVTAAALASLPVYPPFPNSFSHGLSSASLRYPEAYRGLCPAHRPGPGLSLCAGRVSRVDWVWFPCLVSPGLGPSCPYTCQHLSFLSLSLLESPHVSFSACTRVSVCLGEIFL